MSATTTTTAVDRYPTRDGGDVRWIDRVEPTVHGDGAGPLSSDQVETYRRAGAITVPAMFDADEVRSLDAALEDLVDNLTQADRHRLITEPDSDDVRSVFQFHLDHGPLAQVVADDRLAGVARQLLGSDVYIHQSRVNRKPAFHGADFQWHSDFETWHSEDGMPTMRCLSASLALTPNHTWNGPLMVIPGSHEVFVSCPTPTPENNHEKSLVVQEVGVPDEASITTLHERHGIEQCVGPAGSVTFFDCNVLHASGSNVSPVPRRNLFLVFNSVENTLVEPFGAPEPRPEHIAARRFDPVG